MIRSALCLLVVFLLGCKKPETVYITQRVEVPVAVIPARPELPKPPELEIVTSTDGPSEIAGKVARNFRRLLLYSQELERIYSTVWSSGNDTLGTNPHP